MLTDQVATDSDCAQQLMIVALNNQAQIYYDLGKFDETIPRVELLGMMSDAVFLSDDKPSMINANHLDEISINKIAVIRPPTTAACA